MLNLGRNCKNSFRVCACCFVNKTVTYFNLLACPFNMAFAAENDTSNVKTCLANLPTGFLHMFLTEFFIPHKDYYFFSVILPL